MDSPETLLKYIGGLHGYLRHIILIFNPTSLDDVSVQATHLEDRGKNVNPEVGGTYKYSIRKRKEKNNLKWNERKENIVQNNKPSCIRCKKGGHNEAHCWLLHPELKPKKFGGKERKNVAAIQ